MDGAYRQFIYKDASWQRDPELDADLNMQLLYKNSDYAYEHEWRFSIKAENPNKQRFPFISALYAGKDITDANMTRLVTIATNLKVPVYRQIINSEYNRFSYVLLKK